MQNNTTEQNFKYAIDKIYIGSMKSKTGVDYEVLKIKLINGFEDMLFLDSAKWFAYKDAFSKIDSQKSKKVL